MKFKDSCPEYLIPLIKLVEWGHSSEAQLSRVCVVIYVDLEKYQPSAVVSIIKIQHVHKQEKWAEVKKLSFCQVTAFVWLSYFSW